MAEPQLIVGLGNPGASYEKTRHNAGFWFVDALADHLGLTWQNDQRYGAQLTQYRIGTRSVRLLKPMKFMNCSGPAVARLAAFYRIAPENILVAHDELDLASGAVRFKLAGGHGGHNGLRDIHAQMSANFWRLRIGIGHPGHKDAVVGHVLGQVSKGEKQNIDQAIAQIIDMQDQLLSGDYPVLMNTLHSHK